MKINLGRMREWGEVTGGRKWQREELSSQQSLIGCLDQSEEASFYRVLIQIVVETEAGGQLQRPSGEATSSFEWFSDEFW